jgi:hypothetical protein
MHLLPLKRHIVLLLKLLFVVSSITLSLSATGREAGAVWPSGVPRHPLFVLGSPDAETDKRADELAETRAFRRALDVYEKVRSSIVVTGLFVDGRVLSERAIASLLVGNRLSFVEATPADTRWIFFIAKNPGAEALKARSKKYVRFRLEKAGHKDCFRGNNESPYYSAVRSLPGVVDSCMVLEYSDELLSDYRLGIDLTNSANRIAYYELSVLRTGQKILRIPCWYAVRRGILQVPDDYWWTDIKLEQKIGSLVRSRSALSSLLLRMRGPHFLPLE